MSSVCVVQSHATVYSIKIMNVVRILLQRIYVAGYNKIYLGLHEKCPTYLSKFNQIWNFPPDRFSWNSPDFTEINRMGSALIHAGRQTDTTKLMGAFRDYTKASKNSSCLSQSVFMSFEWLSIPTAITFPHTTSTDWFLQWRRDRFKTFLSPRQI